MAVADDRRRGDSRPYPRLTRAVAGADHDGGVGKSGHEQLDLMDAERRASCTRLFFFDPKHTAHYTRVAGHRFEGLQR